MACSIYGFYFIYWIFIFDLAGTTPLKRCGSFLFSYFLSPVFSSYSLFLYSFIAVYQIIWNCFEYSIFYLLSFLCAL